MLLTYRSSLSIVKTHDRLDLDDLVFTLRVMYCTMGCIGAK